MNITTILSVIVALVIGLSGGYAAGRSGTSAPQNSQEVQSAVSMMNEQSARIVQMGEMMKTSGTLMQEKGTKYGDDTMVEKGKDLQAVGEKYLNQNASDTTKSDMRQMMTR